jgi:hypothetical protein
MIVYFESSCTGYFTHPVLADLKITKGLYTEAQAGRCKMSCSGYLSHPQHFRTILGIDDF